MILRTSQARRSQKFARRGHRTRADADAIVGDSIEGALSLAIAMTVITPRATTHHSAASDHHHSPYAALPINVGPMSLATVLAEPCMRITRNTLPLVPL